jgi:tetratricopeptide (TPR) repeat protein
MRCLAACAAVAWAQGALASPAAPDLVAGCQWATGGPQAVTESCTSLLDSPVAAEPWMYFNRGLAFHQLGRLEDAERDYSKAIEMDPSYAAAYINRGNVRLLRNDATAALADYRKAVRLDPTDKTARQNLRSIERALRAVGVNGSGAGVQTGPAR